MLVGLLSDVHGNLPALEAVLEDGKDIDKWASLGDTVGYMPWPNEVMDLVWDITDLRVAGNHDLYAYDMLAQNQGRNLAKVSGVALEVIQWTVENLSEDNKTRILEIGKLPLLIRDISWLPNFSFSHSQPDEHENMARYIYGMQAAKDYCFNSTSEMSQHNVSAHIHSPQVYILSKDNGVKGGYGKEGLSFDLSDAQKSMIVVPSVGQPRDGDMRTGYAVFDTETQVLEFIRLGYDVDRVARKLMEEPGFPRIASLRERLFEGR